MRVCSSGSAGRLEVASPIFWTKEWPRLIRCAAEALSLECLCMLLSLRPPGSDPPPPPPRTLGWIFQGIEKASSDPKDKKTTVFTQHFLREALPRLTSAPLALSTQDGLCIIRLGGLRGALNAWGETSQAGWSLSSALSEAWRRWVSLTKNTNAAVDWLAAPGVHPSQVYSRTRAFEDIALALPLPRRQALAARWTERCAAFGVFSSNSSSEFQALTQWYRLFARQGLLLQHPAWTRWEEKVERGVIAAGESAAAAWFSMAVESPQGEQEHVWRCSHVLLVGWLRSHAHHWDELWERHKTSQWIGHQRCAQAATVLRQALAVERWAKNDCSREEWVLCVTEAWGADWEARMQRLSASADHDMDPLAVAWSRWQAQHLDTALAEAPASVRRRPRV